MLAKIKILLGDKAANYSDDLLQLMLDMAQAEVLAYCNRDTADTSLESIIMQMVLARLNKQGNEGIASVGYSGVSESYINGLDNDTLRLLNSKRRLRVVY